jgi:hypothetical protein
VEARQRDRGTERQIEKKTERQKDRKKDRDAIYYCSGQRGTVFGESGERLQ